MRLRDFFERTMQAASGPLRWSDVVAAEIAANNERRAERAAGGRRRARSGHPTRNTRKNGKARRRKH